MKISKRVFVLIIILLLAQQSFAQKQWTEFTYDKVATHLAFSGTDLWVGTSGGGVYKWNTESDTYIKYTRVNDGLAGNFINDLVVDINGNVWAATFHGLSKFNGTKWINYNTSNSGLTENSVLSLAVDTNGTDVWIGTYQSGLLMFDGSNWNQYDISNSNISDNYVTSIKIAPNGDKWLGHAGAAVDKFDGANWTAIDSVFIGTARYVKATDSNNVWVWSYGEIWGGYVAGIHKYDGNNWTTYTLSNCEIISDLVSSIEIDNDQNVWFGTESGISVFDGNNWINYANVSCPVDLNFSNQNRIAIDANNEAWFGTYDGISKFDDGSFTHHTTNGIQDNYISDIEVGSNNLTWIASRAGLHKYDGVNWEIFNKTNSNLPSNNITSLEEDPNGDIWVGTNLNGACEFDGVNWINYNTSNSGIHSNNIQSIAIDDNGNLWFASGFYSTQISRFDGENWTIYTPGGWPGSITADTMNGNIWICTNTGAIKFDGVNWETYNTNDGLISDLVRSIAVDLNGDIWFGTKDGVSKYDGINWTNFSVENGLADNWINDVHVDPEGIKWFGTQMNGISRYDGISWENYNWSDSLINNRVYTISTDQFNNQWFGTDYGISVFNKNGVVTNYSENNTTEKQFDILIYPNPTNSLVNIEIRNITSKKLTIELMDSKGQIIAIQNRIQYIGRTALIDLSIYPKGIYFIKVKSGQIIKTRKILKY